MPLPANQQSQIWTGIKELTQGWCIKSSDDITEQTEVVSADHFNSDGWYPATVPSTVLDTLVKNGIYQNPYPGMNLRNIPTAPFATSWWFRTEFDITQEQAAAHSTIQFDGINYKANIWLNGELLADAETAEGSFRRFRFDSSKIIKAGKNRLAVEVFPRQPGQFSVGFVDWNPAPPDQNMGIFRPVTLHFFDRVSIENPYVQSTFKTESFQQAELNISAELVNHSRKKVYGQLQGEIDAILFKKEIALNPGQRKKISFTTESFPELELQNPRLWWPVNLGNPNLYHLKLTLLTDGQKADSTHVQFGIRRVDDYLNDAGHRGFIINGYKTLIKGAGWTDDMLLADTHDTIEAQLRYVKHINLNCIRLEGFWGKDHRLYDLCDQLGILIMAGWSCHWEHEIHLGKKVDPRYGGITAPDEIELIAQSWEDQLLWLRNHPSIFVWSVASDMVPHPELEKKYFEIFNKYDSSRPYLNSTGGIGSDQGIITNTEIISEVSGSSGVKMLGPYDHTPPVYWYTNTNLGGAYGFNSETCPGANVPPLDSIKKMIPAEHHWPPDKVWDYHCALYEFGRLDLFKEALEKRYGKSEDVFTFCQKSQIMNYELMRPMFEAFQANKGLTTGIIQWMLNSAWPSLYWQLYDHYLMPNGAFYATKKACAPLHLIYHYGEQAIYFVNDTKNEIENHTALIRIFDIDSATVLHEEIPVFSGINSSGKIFVLPKFHEISGTYFLDLRLISTAEEEIANNFYWLSRKDDVLDYDFRFEDFAFHTPSKEFADFSLLNSMPAVKIVSQTKWENKGQHPKVQVELSNPSNKIAFCIELQLYNQNSGESVLPVMWTDNYISLLPGETRIISARYNREDMVEGKPGLKLNGLNIKI